MKYLKTLVKQRNFGATHTDAAGRFYVVRPLTDSVVGTGPAIVTDLTGLTELAQAARGSAAPHTVGKGQLYAALVAEGWFPSTEAADTAIAAILAGLPETIEGQPYREVMRALFLKASTVDIDNPLVEIIRASLPKTAEQRDALFIKAAKF